MKLNKIKILFIHHGTGIGGAPISLLNLISHLDISKYEFKVVLVKESSIVDMFRQNGIETQVLNASDDWFIHQL